MMSIVSVPAGAGKGSPGQASEPGSNSFGGTAGGHRCWGFWGNVLFSKWCQWIRWTGFLHLQPSEQHSQGRAEGADHSLCFWGFLHVYVIFLLDYLWLVFSSLHL